MKIIEQDLTKYSTIRTKSHAKYFALVKNINDLKSAFQFKIKNNLEYVVLGSGSNILFSKEKYDNILFIKLSSDFNFFKIKNNFVSIGAAYSLKLAGKNLIKNGYKDYIFFNLIPACVGGAITQNAGIGGSEEIKNVCIGVKLYNIKTDEVIELSNEKCQFGYRNSIIKRNSGEYVVLSAKFRLSNKIENIESLIHQTKERIKEKINREPSGYSFGSTFMNSETPAWKVVKAIKEKLEFNNGAFYSDKHNNWIINKSAKGEEIHNIIKQTKLLALKELNLILKNEVRVI